MKLVLSTISAALFAATLFSYEAVAAIQCYQCHGTSGPADFRPLDATHRNISTGGFSGNHRNHMGIGATPASCNPCHGNGVDVSTYLPSHRNGSIDMIANINNSPKPGGATYSKGVFFNQTSNPITGTCSNVNCHFERTTPSWGIASFTSPNDCNQCHGAPPSGGTAGAAGSHAKHDSYYTGAANCAKCHSDHTAETNKFAHATSAGKRNLSISFAAAPNNGSGAYSGLLNDYLPSQSNTFGNCTATYCHSPGNKASSFDAANSGAPTWGSGSLTCKGCHKADNASGDYLISGSHRGHINGQGMGYTQINCVKCHAATVNSSMTIINTANHVNGQVTVAFNNISSAVAGYYNSQLAKSGTPSTKAPGSAVSQCTTVYCHSSGQGDGGTWPPTYQTPTWGTASTGQCGTCHGIQTKHDKTGFGIGTPTSLTTGSHSKHLAFDLGTGNLSAEQKCAACHSYVLTGYSPAYCNSASCHGGMATKHANYEINVGIPDYYGATATYNAASLTPGTGYSTCSNVYCHSDGKATPTTYATPTWGNVASGACGTCHGVTATAPPASIPHAKHLGSANPYLFACAECHNGKVQVTANSTIAPTFTNLTSHVNKSRDVKFDPTNPFGTYSSATTTCRNLYCHSTGNTSVAAGNLPGVYGGKVYVRQGWTGSVSCNSCHGRSTSNGMPDYTNAGAAGSATANSHQKHVASSAIACVECHEKTTKNNASIRLTTPSYHVAGTPSVYFNLSGANKNGSYNSTIGQKNCSSTYCHGAASSVSWGGSTICTSCHGATFTTFSSAVKKGAHAKHIETDANIPTSYTISGLGNLNNDPTKYQYGCASCHNPLQAGHANALANGGTGAAEVYFGYSSASLRGTYNPGTVQPGTDNGFKWTNGNNCNTTYCHSNGNGSNGAINVAWNTPNGTLGCTGCHGDAASNTLSGKHQAHVNNSATFGTNNSFGCVECHAKTVSSNTSISDKRKHVNKFKDYSGAKANDNYNSSTKACTNVYCHSDGNLGSLVYVNPPAWNSATTYLCSGCHGTSNPATGAPDYTNGGVGTNTANNHSKHVTQLNITDTTGCAVCHKRTVDSATANKLRNYSTLHLNGAPNVAFNSTKTGVNATWSVGTCTNVSCHSNGRGTYQSPQWGQTGNCGFCHPVASLGGAHTKHLDLTQTPVFYNFTANRSSGNDATGRYYFGCSNCHPLANSNHTNGTIVIDFKPAVAGVSTLRSKNSASITVSGAVGTVNSGTSGTSGTSVLCSGVYCHSNGYAANLVFATTPNWYGGSFTDRCASCHGNSPNSTIAGSTPHTAHVVSIHNTDINNGATGLIPPAGISGTVAGHGDPAQAATINCNICHNATVTSNANDSGSACVNCHGATKLYGAAAHGNAVIANKANHVNGTVKISFQAPAVSKAQLRQYTYVNTTSVSNSWLRNGTTNYKTGINAFDTSRLTTGWTAGGTCSTVSCHNGRPVNWYNDAGKAAQCIICHTNL